MAALRSAYTRPAAEWPEPSLDPGVAFLELGDGRSARRPADERANAVTRLGERLFHDRALSASGGIACVDCHDPMQGWADGRPRPIGAGGREGRRNAPGLADAAQRTSWRWDGRFTTLSEAALAPLTDPVEMANPDLDGLSRRLDADSGLAEAFARAFGGGPTPQRLGAALSAYVAGIDADTRFDRFAAGDGAALSDQEIHGLHLFRTKARCANCHFGPALTDEGFHNLRLSSFGEASQDLGRHAVTGLPDDAGRFRTPSLRHVARTAPYMHNGLFRTLDGVINLYARGGGEVRAAHQAEADRQLFHEAARLDPLIRPLDLTGDEKAALAAFLRAL